ncbi:MAG TPA: Hsp20/alpha crystallin family protein, partial [Kiritimatiellae bacterium]|nr:Hsp20/alpha crystallin family protein [Kiritimatiellia bacterium]
MTNEVAQTDKRVTGVEDLPVYVPAADVYEAPDRYVISVDLPGVGESDLELNLEEGVLRIAAVRPELQEAQGRSLIQEWEPCRYERSFRLAS